LFILAKDLLVEAMVNKESPGRAGRGLRPAAAGEAQLKQFMKYD
jgi:hypothetical protein